VWMRAGRDTQLLGIVWLTSGPSTASYIIKDFQTSIPEIQKCDLSVVQNSANLSG
jgi:hypothetical protein